MKAKLSRRQERALIALLENDGSSLALVAKKSGISESSLFRYMRQEAFLSRWRELRAQAVEQAVSNLQSLAGEAVATMRRNLSSGHAPSEVRTAVSILRQSLEAVDLFDLAQRIARLEKDVAPKPHV
jgi:lambda repressor-like predicted transcriptional regulator